VGNMRPSIYIIGRGSSIAILLATVLILSSSTTRLPLAADVLGKSTGIGDRHPFENSTDPSHASGTDSDCADYWIDDDDIPAAVAVAPNTSAWCCVLDPGGDWSEQAM